MTRPDDTGLQLDRWFWGSIGLAVLLALGVGMSIQNTRRLSEGAAWVTHSYEVLDGLAEVRARMEEVDSLHQTCLITDEVEPSVGLEALISAAMAEINRVQALTADNQQQQRRIAELRAGFEKLTAQWQESIAVRNEQSFDAARQLMTSRDELGQFDKVRAQLREMDNAERSLLLQRLDARRESYRWALFVGAVSGVTAITGVIAFTWLLQWHLQEQRASARLIAEQQERLRTTFASIGDAVITTDKRGLINGMNPVAEALTGWSLEDANDRALETVFRIVDEETRKPAPNPAEAALGKEAAVGLSGHTLLISKDGVERSIDDVAAPIRTQGGDAIGCVLVFRDVSERRQQERRLQQLFADAHLLATIVESSNDAIISKSLDGTIQTWNAAAETLFGYTAEEAVGQPITLIVPQDRLHEEEGIIARLRRGEHIDHLETQRLRRDGALVEVMLTISPLRDENGLIYGASKIARDITAKKQTEQALQKSEERFRDLADNISQFAWMADPQGWIFWYNRRWYEYTGTTLKEMQGWGWKKVHHPDHVDRVVKRVQHSWDTGEVWEDLFPLRSKEGEYRWFLSRALPIRDDSGRILRWFGTNTDVTEQRDAEEALRETDRRKNEFLAMLAHELRNPLAPVANGLELLAREKRYSEETVTLLREQIEQLVRLVDDLLDVSRIMRGRIELRRSTVDVVKIARRSVDAVNPLIQQRKQTLSVNLPAEPLWLHADSVRVGQVLDNLLNNASKYSDVGKRIELSIAKVGKEAVIRVIDQGIGIEQALLPYVFDLFTQASRSLDRSQGGLGIGLTVVRRLIELHGGEVAVFSQGAGQGATFEVRLPTATAPPIATNGEASPAEEQVDAVARRVLVVDDNHSAAWVLSKLLEKLGDHQVATAQDGPEALRMFPLFHPEIVFLDIGLPGMDGYELARALRDLEGGEDAYLVALTGYGQEEDRQRTQEAGFDQHLVKPADIREIEQALNAAPPR